MKIAETAKKVRFNMLAEQERFMEGFIKKGKIYSVNGVQDKLDAFCRKRGIPRPSDRFCLIKIGKYGGRLGPRGGPRNMIGMKPRKIRRRKNKNFAFCPHPDAIG